MIEKDEIYCLLVEAFVKGIMIQIERVDTQLADMGVDFFETPSYSIGIPILFTNTGIILLGYTYDYASKKIRNIVRLNIGYDEIRRIVSPYPMEDKDKKQFDACYNTFIQLEKTFEGKSENIYVKAFNEVIVDEYDKQFKTKKPQKTKKNTKTAKTAVKSKNKKS